MGIVYKGMETVIEALNTRLPDTYNVDMIFLGMTFCINNEVNT